MRWLSDGGEDTCFVGGRAPTAVWTLRDKALDAAEALDAAAGVDSGDELGRVEHARPTSARVVVAGARVIVGRDLDVSALPEHSRRRDAREAVCGTPLGPHLVISLDLHLEIGLAAPPQTQSAQQHA